MASCCLCTSGLRSQKWAGADGGWFVFVAGSRVENDRSRNQMEGGRATQDRHRLDGLKVNGRKALEKTVLKARSEAADNGCMLS